MLPKGSRISISESKKLKAGVNKKTPLFNAKIYYNKSNDNINKLAIIISKKYLKKSNKRNALKRKICYAYLSVLKTFTNTESDKKTILLYYTNKDINQNLPDNKLIEDNLKIILK